MIQDLFSPMQLALLLYIVLLLSIALHEYGHAKMADLLGDPLPRAQGRVTLDPRAHWDMLGTLILPGIMILGPAVFGSPMPLALIGWGKPVFISLPNAATRKRDDILVTLAGPFMNLLIAVGAAILGGLLLRFAGGASDSELVERVATFLILTLSLNVGLIAFNLIPLPPLDGSHVAKHLFGMREETYLWLARNGFWIMLILINIDIPLGGQTRSVMGWFAYPIELAVTQPLIHLMSAVSGIPLA